jgi:TRAP-type C4-dicarboxylate transport system permease small subunit
MALPIPESDMRTLDRLIELGCTQLAVIGGWMLIGSAFFVAIEVVGRKLFAVSLDGANEISAYVMAISSSWAFSYTLLQRGHICIDAIHRYLPERARAAIGVLSMISLAAFAGLLVWFSFRLLEFAWVNDQRANTTLRTPQWIPLLLWYGGLILFLCISTLAAIRSLYALVIGDITTARRLSGMSANEAEIELGSGNAAVLKSPPAAGE